MTPSIAYFDTAQHQSLALTPIDHDQLFKQLLETFFVEFIELFAPALTQLTFLPQQYFTDIIDGDRKAIDILVQVPVKPNQSTPSSSTSKTKPPAKPTSPNSTANTASPSTPLIFQLSKQELIEHFRAS
jgi:hypothetical protein